MADLWFPQVNRIIGKNASTFLSGYKMKGVLHTTEGTTVTGAVSSYRKTGSWPHFTIGRDNSFSIYQHIPLNLAGRALENPSGGVETNRGGAIQIEVVGFAREAGAWPYWQIESLKTLMRWIEAQTGIRPYGPEFGSNEQYGLKNPLEFTGTYWKSFNGWCGHQHVPENRHWDPGKIDLKVLLEVKPMFDPAECFAFVRTDPTNGGWIAVKPDGAIFNGDGSIFYGGMNENPHFADRKAAKIVFPEDDDPKFIPGYKYMIVSTNSEYYGLPI